MRRKRIIHTTLKPETYKFLMEYGGGVLNEGIERVVRIVKKQEDDIFEEIKKILHYIIKEYRKSL